MDADRRTLILNVDDDEVGRYAVTQMLRRGGYAVVEAATGGEALRLVEAERPDLVILDVNLPDVNGTEVARRIKSGGESSLIPILHLSATHVEVADQVAGLEAGGDAYLTWPVEGPVLLATIGSLLRARAAEARAASIARQWQATVEATRDGIAIVDADGAVIRANRMLARLTGIDPGELIGRRVIDLFAPDDDGEPWGTPRPRSDGRSGAREVRFGQRWFLVSMDPLIDPDGRITGGVQVFTEITDQKRSYDAEATSRSTLAAIVEHMPIGLVVCDVEGRIVLHNRRAEAIVGGKLEGRSLLDPDVLPTVDADGVPLSGVSPLAAAMRDGATVEDLELDLGLPDGRARSIVASSAPVRDDEGQIVATVAAFSDITERKALDAIRDTFIGILSHELRTPVTSILGFSRLLADGTKGIASERRGELIGDIADEAERLHRLVEDLLVLARTERGVPLDVADPVLLQHVIPAVVASERRLWPEVRFDVTIGELDTVSGDDAYVGQIVRNPPLERREVRTRGRRRGGHRGARGRRHVRPRAGPGPGRGSGGARPAVRPVLSDQGGAAARVGRGHRAVRVPPAGRGDGRPHLGDAPRRRRDGVRLPAASVPRWRPDGRAAARRPHPDQPCALSARARASDRQSPKMVEGAVRRPHVRSGP